MTPAELRACLARLGLKHQSRLTARLLGITGREVCHYLAGERKIARPVIQILALLELLHGTGASPAAIDKALTEGRHRAL